MAKFRSAFVKKKLTFTLYNAAFFVVLFEFGGMLNEIRQILKGSVIVLRHYGI